MKKAFQILILVLFFILSCKKEANNIVEDESAIETEQINQLPKLPSISKLSSKVKIKTENWDQFKNLEAGIQRLYGSGDALTEAEELINLEIEFSKSTFPDEFNRQAIKARFFVLKTFSEKLQAAAKENESEADLQAHKAKVIESYNSFRQQLNEALSKDVPEDFLKNE